jgi:hypothetical protein
MAKPKKKIKLQPVHVTYNKKAFLETESIRTMAAVHTKINKNGEAILRISDCNNCIRIWNDLNIPKEKKEMLIKVKNLRAMLLEFENELISRQ